MSEFIDLISPVANALRAGNYALAGALGLILAVALVRRYGGAKWPFLASKKAAPFLVLAGSFGAALATPLGAGSAFSAALAWGALKMAVTAAGSYSLLKPVLEGLSSRAPAWMSPLFALAGWIFDSKSRAEKAREAGDAAVAANPAEGSGIEFDKFP